MPKYTDRREGQTKSPPAELPEPKNESRMERISSEVDMRDCLLLGISAEGGDETVAGVAMAVGATGLMVVGRRSRR